MASNVPFDAASHLCIVPVRGGSKGVPRKNALALWQNVSLLEWTLREAQQSGLKDALLVSTEDAELAAIAERCGVRVALRPAHLAQDDSSSADVVAHVLEGYGEGIESVSIVQATSPLRTAADMDGASALFASGAYDCVVSACEYDGVHPAKMYIPRQDGSVQAVVPDELETRRQSRPKVCVRNGAIYLLRRSFFEQSKRLWGGETGLYMMPKERSLDIDTLDDLERARDDVKQHLALFAHVNANQKEG